MPGKLYICATPIGNLDDITLRVLSALKEVDLIAAEDTRQSIKILNHFNIKTPMTSYHEHNKVQKGREIVDKLLAGANVALITDAGTPAISDPGEDLVKACYEAGIEVTSLPGPSACITALTLSGLPARRFAFEAFLPSDKKARTAVIEELKEETRTIVLYEAPHHLIGTLEELYEALGDRRISICKELTKVHETVGRTTFSEALRFYEMNEPKGEYVLVIEGKDPEEIKKEEIKNWEEMTIEDHLDLYLSEGFDKKEAMRRVAKDRGISRRDVYNYFISGSV